MNKDTWIDHLTHWEEFLHIRLQTVEDEGEAEKIKRQLKALKSIRLSAVLNPQLLIDFINPTDICQTESYEPTEYYLDLNTSQKDAVAAAIGSERNLLLIQGPPGTGKTQVIAEICLQVFRLDPNVKILVCSETHVAVNNLVSRIAKTNQDIRCLRIRDKEQDSELDAFSPMTIVKSYQEWLSDICDDQDVINLITETLPDQSTRGMEKALALSANVIGMTCNRAGAYHFLISTEMFDYVIIDEVCKATLPEILIPLTAAKKAILVGDPKQLPPVFCSEDIEIIKSIENCNLQKYMYIDDLFSESKDVKVLDTQYRMENSIGSLISTTFYDGTLKNGRDVMIDDSLLWLDYIPTHDWPPEEEIRGEKPIIRNLDECKIICRVLEQIAATITKKTDIAIIVPYRNQIYELRRAVHDYNLLKITVDTVDGFQGKEADIVIFGVTRTSGTFRFLADPRRLNVALSRAKDRIIIVGSKKYALQHVLFKKIAKACRTIQVQL